MSELICQRCCCVGDEENKVNIVNTDILCDECIAELSHIAQTAGGEYAG